MHPPVNRYLVVAWITVALALLSSGALIALSTVQSVFEPRGLSVPWIDLYFAFMALGAFWMIVTRRPVLGIGRCPVGYTPRRSLIILSCAALLMSLMLWSGVSFTPESLTETPAMALAMLTSPLRLFAIWTWMLAVTAFPAWHNDPAWGQEQERGPSLPRRAGRMVRRLFVRVSHA